MIGIKFYWNKSENNRLNKDIQELYKVSMSIDNMGRAYCFEYREV